MYRLIWYVQTFAQIYFIVMHEGKVLHKFAKAHEEGVNGLLKRLGGSRAGMYYVLGKEKLGAEKKSEIAQSYETNVQTIWVPEPKKRDDTLHYEGEPPLNEIDPSDLPEDLQPKASAPKETIYFGKNPNMRLKPEDYAEAFGDWKGLPIYNSPITASFIETYRDTKVMEPYYYLHDPRFKDCDFGAIITGDSMYPEIRHGDIVLCKNIDDKSFIVYGDIYYVVASNGLETCKYVNGHDNEDYLMLVPRNEKIRPSPIHKDMLLRLYKLRGLIRGY